ncbi:hypothetical protein KNE206_28320 [Kitasatospora sp. NE20-6]
MPLRGRGSWVPAPGLVGADSRARPGAVLAGDARGCSPDEFLNGTLRETYPSLSRGFAAVTGR